MKTVDHPTGEELEINLRFLFTEVQKLVEGLCDFLDGNDDGMVVRVQATLGYVNSLRVLVEKNCFVSLNEGGGNDDYRTLKLRAYLSIASNMVRIAHYVMAVIVQVGHLHNPAAVRDYPYSPFLDEIRKALRAVERTLGRPDLIHAFRVCRSENKTDTLFVEVLGRLGEDARSCPNSEDIITIAFVFQYMERMGDALLNVGESLLSIATGANIKVHEYYSMQKALHSAGIQDQIAKLRVEPILGTRSGDLISKVTKNLSKDKSQTIIFKHGEVGRIRKEMEMNERWTRMLPGITPRILGWQDENGKASMVEEFIQGHTLEQLILGTDVAVFERAMRRLRKTFAEIWELTRVEEQVHPGFVDQLEQRLPDVRGAHPEFSMAAKRIGCLEVPSFKGLLELARAVEEGAGAPFSVWIHGDCNLNNLLYEAELDGTRFIDVHRSARSDYLQDISVLLVSIYRLPIFDRTIRNRLNRHAISLLTFARGFAAEVGDEPFEVRLALGLARSMVTSTRFVQTRAFAREMFYRGIYLLEKVTGEQSGDFRIPNEVIIH